MNRVTGVGIYAGPRADHPLVQGKNLMVPDNGAICQTFRRALLDSPGKFEVNLDILKYPTLSCHWTGCCQTAGVAVWTHGKEAEAAGVYFNGLLPKEEVQTVGQMLSERPLPISMYHWRQSLKYPRPVFITFFFTPAIMSDPTLATAAPALANSFFSLMGTVEETKA